MKFITESARLALALCAALSLAPRVGAGQSNAAPPSAAPRSAVIDAARMLRDLETLSSDAMQGRRTGTEGGAKARAYVAAEFGRIGLRPFGKSYLQPFSFERQGKKIDGANVVGYLPGASGGSLCLVVSAHYDHVGVIKGEIYNGADDNASGTAALLAVAAHLARHRPAHNVVFAALDGEEMGLRGSQAFVRTPPVELSRVVLDVNMDMVSRNDRGELYAAGAHLYPFLRPYLEAVAARSKIRLVQGHDDPALGAHDDWTNQSDQGSFHAAGVPFVYFGVEDHPDYHRPTDDFERVQPEFFVRAAETVLDAVKTFDANLEQLGRDRARRPPAKPGA
jgi:Zn-dependent M28 family amino/carboxypeptidase